MGLGNCSGCEDTMCRCPDESAACTSTHESCVHVQPHNRLIKSLLMMLVFRFFCSGFLFRLNSHIGEHFWTHQSATGVNR